MTETHFKKIKHLPCLAFQRILFSLLVTNYVVDLFQNNIKYVIKRLLLQLNCEIILFFFEKYWQCLRNYVSFAE